MPPSIRYVHLQWDGPITWKEKAKLKSAKDYGIYQIYGYHPVHGGDCLLYIGKASDQPFAARLGQEVDWMYDQDVVLAGMEHQATRSGGRKSTFQRNC